MADLEATESDCLYGNGLHDRICINEITILYHYFQSGYPMNTKVSVAEAHSHLSKWLKRVKTTPVTITNRGKPVGVIISPEKYEQMRRIEAYLRMLKLAKTLREEETGVTAKEVYEASRGELETRHDH
ncbi:type II toxin-antitoxin system Phd/YefM family antitoxin [Candidatus Parcubacteria bacterium]|nr:MAG: type II toxin-antitoxin system Phd/YefM family antitoxin [Candidatus Parcubacteria bacterium]